VVVHIYCVIRVVNVLKTFIKLLWSVVNYLKEKLADAMFLVRRPVKKAGRRWLVGRSFFLTRLFCLLFAAMAKSKSPSGYRISKSR
jgi:hypothetical protein